MLRYTLAAALMVTLCWVGVSGADSPPANGARAYALVHAGGKLDKRRSHGIAMVRITGAGNYCLTLDPATGIDPARTAWAVSIVHGTITTGQMRVAYSSPQTCDGPLDIGVRTAWSTHGRVEPRDSAFAVVVP